MPIVHQERGFVFFLMPEEIEPPKVHVRKGETTIQVVIGIPGKQPPSIQYRGGFFKEDLELAKSVVARHQEKFLREWNILQRPRALIDLHQALLGPGDLTSKAKKITNSIVDFFSADFCRIWVVRPGDLCEKGCVHFDAKEKKHVCGNRKECLHLIASSGRYSDIHGSHRRVPLGAYKIGRVASGADRKFLTNDVTHDKRVHDREWAAGLGLVSFAGYQLRPPDGQTLGVLALFSRFEISPEEDSQLELLGISTAQVIRMASTEEVVQTNEQRELAFMDNSADAIWGCDRDSRILFANRTAFLWTGRDPVEVIGKRLSELFPSEIARLQEKKLEGVFATGKPFEGDFEMPIAGKPMWQNVRIYPVSGGDGKVISCLGIIRDITEQKRMLASLENSREQLSKALTLAQAGYWELDLETNTYTFSDEVFKIYGTTAENEGGYSIPADRVFREFVFPDDLPMVREKINRALRSTEEFPSPRIEHRILRRDCQIRTVVVQATVPAGSGEGGKRVKGVIQDITDQRRNEEMERFHSLLLDHMSEGVMLTRDLDLGIVYVNPAFERMFGYGTGELLGKNVKILIPPEFSETAFHEIADSMKTSGKWSGRLRNIRKDGSVFWSSVAITGFCHPVFGQVEITVQEDITERLEVEKERDRLASAISQSGEVVIITDTLGNIQYVNPTFELVTGYPRDEAIGRNPRFLKGGTHGEEFYRNLWETISSGKVWRGQLRNRRKDGTFFSEEAIISPIRDPSGMIVSYLAVKRDVTELLRLQENEEKLKMQLYQSQKMEAVGRLAGGVAHDFNNMLAVILGYTEMLLSSTSRKSPGHADLKEIFLAAERSKTLTEQLLGFARKQIVTPRVLDLNETIAGMLKMLRRLLGEDLKLVWKPAADAWPVKLDPSQIDQVLVNLCVNSRDSIESNGAIIIETGNVSLDQHFCGIAEGPVSGDYVMLAISDNGRGMTRDVTDHLFEPFFTTKAMGKGTGLGLAVVYGIVRQNNGFIKVYSEPGKGTTFKIYLPKCDDRRGRETDRKIDSAVKGKETILVVEDEEAMLNLTIRMLKILSYDVLSAGTPTEALRLFDESKGKVHLLITDVVMPEMTGRELAEKLSSRNPQLKILFMSGYTANVIAHQGVLDEGISFLQKPFSLATLSIRVREAMEK